MWKTKYFIKINEETQGSYSVDELQSLWDAGTINSDTLIALDGKEPMLFWSPLRNIKTLKAEEVSPSNLALKGDTETTCPKCGGNMTIPKELAGKEVLCPHCNESIFSSEQANKRHKEAERERKEIAMQAPERRAAIIAAEQIAQYVKDGQYFNHGTPPKSRPTTNGDASTNGDGSGLQVLGAWLLVIGLVVTGYYFFVYDTSVVSDFDRVNNLGLMANRQDGIIIGIGLAIVGTIMFVFGSHDKN